MSRKSANYKFDDITVGLTKEFSIEITESMINNFAEFTGDYNELHMDESYASTTSFGKRVCHGILLASFFSRLVGMSIPGKNALYFSQSINFQSPCFIGDQILVRGEVIEKSGFEHMITIKTTILNQDSKCLIDGIAKVIVQN
jgi:acyl dehydratase